MILDTNALSALAEKDPGLLGRLGQARRLATTLISVGEFSYGIRLSGKREELADWLKACLLRVDVLCPDLGTVDQYASVRTELRRAGTPIPANDCWIAALVRQHRLPIVSRDAHFDVVSGIRRIGW
jgi:tRNA(fMet)-specific endonuclease VapC